MTQIVNINVSQQVAPIPSQLMKKGAIVSEGGTSLAVGTVATLTQPSDLTPILAAGKPISASAAAPTGNADTTILLFASPHGLGVGSQQQLTITGALNSAYNGTYNVTVYDYQQVTYSPPGGFPGATGLGTSTIATQEDVGELINIVNVFFEQGNSISVDVIELGGQPNFPSPAVEAGISIPNLQTFMTNNPLTYYAYLVPRSWADRQAFHDMVKRYQGLQSKTYFFVTVRLDNYGSFSNLDKAVFAMIEAPIAAPSASSPNGEYSIASAFQSALSENLTGTGKLRPFAYRYLYGVTPYPTKNNASLLNTLKLANVNVVTPGSEGGITNTMLAYGHMMDGRPRNYWYAVDWTTINAELDLANEVINGSNNPVNPLYYNQRGIDRLQARLAQTFLRGVSYGCVLGLPVQLSLTADELDNVLNQNTYQGKTIINAVPFLAYGQENPSDYRQGIYNGLSAIFVPQAGFEAIIVQMVVSDFVTQ